MRRAAAVVFAIAFTLALAARASAAGSECRLHGGDKVVLYSSSGSDPSVLLWDSPVRLRAYNAATYDEAQAMAERATLVAPGTRALVASCRANFVQSPYSDSPDDAVGITIITGPQRGHNFWVLASDIRGVYHKTKAP
jgi:hypothetical protein